MTPWPPRRLNAVPRDWTVRAEIMKAMRTLAAQEEDEAFRRRRAEFAALRLDCELLAVSLRNDCRNYVSVVSAELRKAGYNPNEPRVPAGNPNGGEWTRESEGSDSTDPSPVLSDATPDNGWIPGAQYAANDIPGISHNQGPPLEDPPKIPPRAPSKLGLINDFLKAAVYWLATAVSSDRRVVRFLAALRATQWLVDYLASIISYFDGPKPWDELQQNALRRRPGYDIHHPVEQTPATNDGFPESQVDGPGNRVSIPRLKHWQITGWYGKKNPEFEDTEGNAMSPRDYLRKKGWDERMRVGKDALILFGVLQP